MKRILIASLAILLISSAIEAYALSAAVQAVVSAGSSASNTVGWTDYSSQGTKLVGSRIYCYGPFATTGSGTATVSKISIYNETASEAVDMKIGLYADSTGVPGAIVSSATEFLNFGDIGGEGLPAGWHDYTVNYSITLGSSYHICINVSVSDQVYVYSDGGTTGTNLNYMTDDYSTTFPETFTSGGTGAAKRAVKMYYTW
jgi:hypothetical protein